MTALTRRWRVALLALLFLPASFGCRATTSGGIEVEEARAPTTIYVVRHAERLSEDDRDSPLSPAGAARARALVEALGESGVDAIYVTQYQRTFRTAEPLATHLGVPILTDSTTGGTEPARRLARRVLERHRGQTVLIVGHSNTVPAIVNALGGPELPELDSSRYGDLFVVTIPASGPVRTIRAQFGMVRATHSSSR
jgi:broad specificity phosphatase PhoE